MKRLLFLILSVCLGFAARAEYNVTSVIYDGGGQQCDYWANTGGAQDEPLIEKPMLPEKNEAPYTTNAKYLEMKRVQESGREWHGIGFDLSGLNTTLSAGNQIAMWVKKDKAENVKLELQFTDGTSAVLSDLQWVAPEDGWKYLVFDFSGQSGDIQGKQLGNMFVQVHTGGDDGQTATISVTGIVKGFDLNDRPDPTANNPIISGSAVGDDEFVMTETQSDIYLWMGSLNADDLQITMSGSSLVTKNYNYDPDNVPDVINLVSSSVMSRSTGSVTIDKETKVVLTLDCSSNDGYRLIINPYPESLYVVGVDSVEDLIPFTNNNGEYVVARYLPPGYNFKISTGKLSKWEPSFVALEVNESIENTYRFDNDNLGQPYKMAYRNSFDIEGKYKDPVEDIWFETPVFSDNQSDNKTYKITVNLTSAYPYILVEETSDISVYVQDKHIIVENAIGEYKIQGLSGGEYHEGIIPVGGTVDELVNCNGIYLVEANGQSKRVLVY